MASLKDEEAKEKMEAKILYDLLTKLTLSEEFEKKDQSQNNENEMQEVSDQREDDKQLDKNVNAKQLRRDLEHLHCHFNWKLFYVNGAHDVESLIWQMERKENEGIMAEEDNWKSFYQTCLLAYCYTLRSRWAEAHKLLDECQQYSRNQTRICSGLLYIVGANRAFIHYEREENYKAVKVLESLNHYEDLDACNQAAVQAIRAVSLMEQGVTGSKAGMKFIQKAIDLDPENAEWHFLMGKIFIRIRHLEDVNGCPSVQECVCLEKAVQLGDSPTYVLFLGQSLREKAKYLFYSLSWEESCSRGVNELNQRSLECYHKALRSNPNCPRLNIRCADGFMKLPKQYRNNELAGDCIKKALELAPNNSMVNQKAGFYYERVLFDYKKAMECYEKAIEWAPAGNFPAHTSLLNMKATVDADFNPFQFLEDMMEKFEETKIQVVSLLIYRGLFHLTINNSITAALKDWYRAVMESSTDFELNFMRISKNSCFKEKLNLTSLMEILEERLIVEDSINKTLLKEQIIPVVKKSMQSSWTGSRGHSRGGRRGGGRGGSRGMFRGGPRGDPRGTFQGGPRGGPRGTFQGGPRGGPRGTFQGGPRGGPRGTFQGGPRGGPRCGPRRGGTRGGSQDGSREGSRNSSRDSSRESSRSNHSRRKGHEGSTYRGRGQGFGDCEYQYPRQGHRGREYQETRGGVHTSSRTGSRDSSRECIRSGQTRESESTYESAYGGEKESQNHWGKSYRGQGHRSRYYNGGGDRGSFRGDHNDRGRGQGGSMYQYPYDGGRGYRGHDYRVLHTKAMGETSRDNQNRGRGQAGSMNQYPYHGTREYQDYDDRGAAYHSQGYRSTDCQDPNYRNRDYVFPTDHGGMHRGGAYQYRGHEGSQHQNRGRGRSAYQGRGHNYIRFNE